MKQTKGFTLIELLVVIAIIGILATIIITSILSARKKTEIVKTATILKDIEKGLFAATLEENRETYWTNTELGTSTSNYLNISDLISITPPNPGWAIKNYLNNTHGQIPGGTVRYRNSEASVGDCGSGQGGVSLLLPDLSLEDRTELNAIFDKGEATGNNNCGKFSARFGTTGNTYSLYRLSRNPAIIDF